MHREIVIVRVTTLVIEEIKSKATMVEDLSNQIRKAMKMDEKKTAAKAVFISL